MMLTQHATRSDYLATLLDRRVLIVFALGVLSGFPWVLIAKCMTLWLQESGLTRSAIGYFGSIFTVYAINFTWAPLVDRLAVPGLSGLGQRRSWIGLCQLAMLGLVLTLSFTNPANSLLWTSLLALSIALFSATQDTAIDAYRIECVADEPPKSLSVMAAAATCGWWTGFGALGSLALLVSDHATWGQVYRWLALVLVFGVVLVLIIPEPSSVRRRIQERDQSYYRDLFGGRGGLSGLVAWLLAVFFQPMREFFQRHGYSLALSILGFIVLFKLGEAFLGRMSLLFYREIGFTKTEIGAYAGLIGYGATIVFTVCAALLSMRYGLLRGLFISGIAMASTNLIFALLAIVSACACAVCAPWVYQLFSWSVESGLDTTMLAVAVVIDNFTGACATVALVAFLSYLTSRAYTATQYAMMASLGNFGRTTLAVFSGVAVDALHGDWALFFVLTTLMVVPGLVLLCFIGRSLSALERASS